MPHLTSLGLLALVLTGTPAAAEAIDTRPTLTLNAPQVTAMPAWRFGGWASAGVAAGADLGSQEAFSHAYLLTTVDDGSGPGVLGLRPFALESYTLQVGNGEGYTDVTFYLTLGESDNWALLTRAGDGTDARSAVGVAYWVDAFQTDEHGQRWQPLQVQALLTEDAGLALRAKGFWGLNEKSPFNYMFIGDVTYEPDGNSRGFVALRHHTQPDLSQFIEAGVYNDRGYGIFAAYGTSW